jgi:chromosome segregation ATPase
MKQNVNFFLMFILVLMLGVMVVMVVWVQGEYRNLHDEYISKNELLEQKNQELVNMSEEINTTRSDLEDRQRALVDIVKELNLSAERESSLGGFFENVKGQKQVLETNLNSTVQEKENWKKLYNTAQNDLGICDKAKQIALDDVKKRDGTIAGLRRDFGTLSLSVNSSKTQLSSIASTVSSLRDDLSDLSKAVTAMSEPADISKSSKSAIKDGLSDAQSTIDNRLDSLITSLRSTLNDIGKRIDGAAKA